MTTKKTRRSLKPPAPGGDLTTSNAPKRDVTVPATGVVLVGGVDVSKTRVDFRQEAFIRVIRQHGKHVWWRKALLCPCGTLETEQARLDCADCSGGGYIYVQPQPIQALMMQFDKKTNIFEKFGLYQSGTVMVTIEPQNRPGYRDSYELRDSVIPMNELLTKNNRRGRRSALPAGVDSARFRIVSVAAMLFKCSGGELVTLTKDVHYTITGEGWIKWTSRGHQTVPDGAQFTIHYDYHPIFLVDSWMHITRNDTSGKKTKPGVSRVEAHPVQAMAKLDFLLDVNATPSLDAIGQPTGFGPAEPSEPHA